MLTCNTCCSLWNRHTLSSTLTNSMYRTFDVENIGLNIIINVIILINKAFPNLWNKVTAWKINVPNKQAFIVKEILVCCDCFSVLLVLQAISWKTLHYWILSIKQKPQVLQSWNLWRNLLSYKVLLIKKGMHIFHWQSTAANYSLSYLISAKSTICIVSVSHPFYTYFKEHWKKSRFVPT